MRRSAGRYVTLPVTAADLNLFFSLLEKVENLTSFFSLLEKAENLEDRTKKPSFQMTRQGHRRSKGAASPEQPPKVAGEKTAQLVRTEETGCQGRDLKVSNKDSPDIILSRHLAPKSLPSPSSVVVWRSLRQSFVIVLFSLSRALPLNRRIHYPPQFLNLFSRICTLEIEIELGISKIPFLYIHMPPLLFRQKERLQCASLSTGSPHPFSFHCFAPFYSVVHLIWLEGSPLQS
ncbi:hypothetical protein IEQ34_011757 [Dendrobium chrysotoxum]|uniref:Uncharacterized protein n=1 Tax=Dendrobium chrysotoxum TaxID=161865 RepID=A0AAV7GTI9_DENCH|nr:hypothetical protein IEQ34_011757 [Dendrobium chrysotoxum]